MQSSGCALAFRLVGHDGKAGLLDFWMGPQCDLPERDSPTQFMWCGISAGVADEPKLNLLFRSYSGHGFHDVDPMGTRRRLQLGSTVHGG